MKKMIGEFKFLVPTVIAISAMLGGCKPQENDVNPAAVGAATSISICAEVRNCENYGSNQGILRFLATARGNIYHNDGKTSKDPRYVVYENISKVYDSSLPLKSITGVKTCLNYDLRSMIDPFGRDRYDHVFNWDAFKLEDLNYQAKDLEGKEIYVDSSNKRVTNINPKTLEILKKENALIITPQGNVGTNSFAHVLNLQPSLTKVDFSAARGEVVFDCQNPQGDGSINTQLSKFLLKETIKNKFRSLSGSATASKEVNESRSVKEQELKDSKKESKESSIAL